MPGYGGFGDESPRRMSYGPAERLSFRFAIGDLADGPKVAEIGPLGRQVRAELAPEGAPRDAEFRFRDTGTRPGINPYWLRVVQTDGEMAWTSPVYVDFVEACEVASRTRIRAIRVGNPCHSKSASANS